MDTSKEYIKQCEKAEEIQNHAQVDEHSYVVSSISGNEISQDDDAFVFEIVKQGGRVIWLPRQDQLQAMIDYSLFEKVNGFFKAYRDFKLTKYHPCEKEFPFASMEQLWLAFVMKEKYNKVWNGEDWLDGQEKERA